jgi:ketosteroid isomerase-like protein
MRRSDVAGLIAHYDEGAIVVPQTTGLCRGRASIEKLFTSWLASARVREFDAETEDLRILDDVALEVGTYRMVVEEAGSGTVRDDGKFLIVYEHKSDGSWLITRDMSSSSKS